MAKKSIRRSENNENNQIITKHKPGHEGNQNQNIPDSTKTKLQDANKGQKVSINSKLRHKPLNQIDQGRPKKKAKSVETVGKWKGVEDFCGPYLPYDASVEKMCKNNF